MRFATKSTESLASLALIGFLPYCVLGILLSTSVLANKSVTVKNASEPVLCAEKDNVTLTFSEDSVRQFRIEATHPIYLPSLRADNWKADWTACDFGPEAQVPGDTGGQRKPSQPKRRTLYEEPSQWVVGWRFDSFWRPATTTFTIGDRVESGLHLVQLWQIRPNGGEEVVVLYPQDGYWRARPLAPRGRDLTAFGSSFLIGPVELDQRPLVKLENIDFDPQARAFTLTFVAGGRATVQLAEVSDKRTALEITFDATVAGMPFAALRSMYLTEFNNDVAKVAVRTPHGLGWREEPIMTFGGGLVTDIWAGRLMQSQHNTSSPDIVFKAFK
ncbi:MAG: hypothetical protein ACR2PG_18050 [Hyphomicrobiaceae bacterium]